MNFCLNWKFYEGAKRLSILQTCKKAFSLQVNEKNNSKNSFCNHCGHVAVTSFTHSPERPVML